MSKNEKKSDLKNKPFDTKVEGNPFGVGPQNYSRKSEDSKKDSNGNRNKGK